jgi:DNA-binding response OmpR family regulator
MKVLLLEDDYQLRELIEHFLRIRSPKSIIFTCETLLEAILIIQTQEIVVAILDFELPDGNSTEILPLLSKTCQKIGMSGKFIGTDNIALFNHFFQKPFNLNQLIPFLTN